MKKLVLMLLTIVATLGASISHADPFVRYGESVALQAFDNRFLQIGNYNSVDVRGVYGWSQFVVLPASPGYGPSVGDGILRTGDSVLLRDQRGQFLSADTNSDRVLASFYPDQWQVWRVIDAYQPQSIGQPVTPGMRVGLVSVRGWYLSNQNGEAKHVDHLNLWEYWTLAQRGWGF